MKPDSIKTGWAGRDDRTRTDMEKFRGILSPLCLPISPHPDGSACEIRTHAYRLEGPACLPLHQDAIVNERNSASPFYTPPHQGQIRRALSRFSVPRARYWWNIWVTLPGPAQSTLGLSAVETFLCPI